MSRIEPYTHNPWARTYPTSESAAHFAMDKHGQITQHFPTNASLTSKEGIDMNVFETQTPSRGKVLHTRTAMTKAGQVGQVVYGNKGATDVNIVWESRPIPGEYLEAGAFANTLAQAALVDGIERVFAAVPVTGPGLARKPRST